MVFFLSDDVKANHWDCYNHYHNKEMEGIDGDGGGKMPADELLKKSSEGVFCYIVILFCCL